MEKIWLQHYPPGVPAEINPDTYQSLAQAFEESCKKFADLPAFYNMGVFLSYKELDQLTRNFAAYLQEDLGLKKGDRLAIMLPNLLQYPVALFGALRADVIVVNVNPLYTVPELAFQLKDSGAETIIVLENFASTVEKALPQTPLKNIIIAAVGDFSSPLKAWAIHLYLKYFKRKIPAWKLPQAKRFKTVLARGAKLKFTPAQIDRQDLAFLQYTGGTTGVAKGAMLTQRNMLANLAQATAWFQSSFVPGKEIVITALPLYHIFSLLVNCLFYTLKVGGLNVLITNPRDIPGMIREMTKFKFTSITGVNTLFNALLKNPQFANLDFSALKLTIGGGMAVQRSVAEQWQAVTGVVLLEGYGLTETSPCVAVGPPNLKTYNGTIGYPLPSTEICILDNEQQEVPPGQPGELAIKGPQVMQGYWQNPAETAKVFSTDGWLLTGDIAVLNEEGSLRILERKKDMILVSGFNVYPNEVEDVIAAIPGVNEVAVVGVPDEGSGEAVKAFIVTHNPEVTEEEVIKYCRQSLTAYKVPRQIEFCAELPKSYVGKILRRTLHKTG